jgi:hypothetical protein
MSLIIEIALTISEKFSRALLLEFEILNEFLLLLL